MTSDSEHDEDEATAKPCPCGVETEPNTFTIECAECECEWHLKCCGLIGLTKKPIQNLERKKWKCLRCFEPAIHIQPAKKPASISEETIDSIVSIVNSTVEENLKQLLSPENLREETPETQKFTLVNRRRRETSIQKVLVEQREEEILIEKKKDSLIIFGMPETNTDDRKEEMLDDYRRIEKLYETKVTLNKEDVTYIGRLGIKDREKNRPIKITLTDQRKRMELLTKNFNLKLLENDISTNIYVSTDRTKKQREADKLLRDELKIKKVTNPNLVIRNNKIVPFRARTQDTTTWASIVGQ